MAPRKEFPLAVRLFAVDRLSPALRRVQRLTAVLGGRLSRGLGLAKVSTSFSVLAGRMGDVGARSLALVRQLGAIAAAATAAAAAIVLSFAKSGDAVAKASTRLGVGIEALQEWRFAAERAGVDSNTFDLAIQRFGRRAAEAAAGTGEARDALGALGIELRGPNGQLRAMEELLPEVADRLAAVESPLARNALAMKLFDSEGVKLVQLLEEGSEGMLALRRRARELGVVLDEDATREAVALTDAMTDTRASLLGIRNTIGAALSPAIRDLATRFTRLVSENRDRVREFSERFAEQLPGRLAELRDGILDVARVLSPFLQLAVAGVEMLGGLRVVVVGLAAAVGLGLVSSLALATAAAIKFTIALATNPIGAVLVLVSGLVLWLGILAKKAFDAGLTLSDVWLGIKLAVASSVDFILDKIRDLTDSLPDWLVGLLRGTSPVSRLLIDQGRERPAGGLAGGLRREALSRLPAIQERAEARAESRVVLDFQGAVPEGLRAFVDPGSDADVETKLGGALVSP